MATSGRHEIRTHEPSLRELTHQVDDLKELINEKIASLRDKVEERDRLYSAQFKASETAVSAALSAQKESTGSAFTASEKAIVKAEDAQREYNVRSNEFRGQLDDQAKTLMPRTEAAAMFKASEDKLEDLKKRLEVFSDYRSGAVGEKAAQSFGVQQKQWSIGMLVIGFFSLASLIVSLIVAMKK